MAGLKPKEEDIIVRTSKDGIVRKTIRSWFCGHPRRRFIVPLFQRRFLWGNAQCRKFFKDALNGGMDLGTVMVYVNEKNELVIVDGQQRATTLMILLASLKKTGADVDDILFYKGSALLHPTFHDQIPFFSVIENKKPVGDSNVISAKSWFDSWTANLTQDENQRLTKNLLDHIRVLEFMIPQGDDSENLQVVYERLAIRSVYMGTLLFNPSPGINNGVLDLTRNLFLSYFSQDEAISVYHSHWMPLEVLVAKNDPVYSEVAETRFMSHIQSFLKGKNWDVSSDEKKDQLGVYRSLKRYIEGQNVLKNSVHITTIIQELLDLPVDLEDK